MITTGNSEWERKKEKSSNMSAKSKDNKFTVKYPVNPCRTHLIKCSIFSFIVYLIVYVFLDQIGVSLPYSIYISKYYSIYYWKNIHVKVDLCCPRVSCILQEHD